MYLEISNLKILEFSYILTKSYTNERVRKKLNIKKNIVNILHLNKLYA
jgi:hypothetical protein